MGDFEKAVDAIIANQPIGRAISYDAFRESATENERQRVSLAYMHAEILNGGFTQWADNGFMASDAKDCLDALEEVGTKAALTIAELIRRFRRIWEEYEKHSLDSIEWNDEDEEPEDDYPDDNPWCGVYYSLNDQFMTDLDLWITDPSKLVKASTKDVDIPTGPKPRVKLVGTDANVFSVIGRCAEALLGASMIKEAEEFQTKCFAANDYDAVLRLAMEYCDVS